MKKTRKWIALLLLLVMVVSTYVVPVSATDPCEHEYEETSRKEATCTEAGEIVKKCKNCTDEIKETIDAKGHTVVAFDAEPATCTAPGKEAGTKCSVCGDTLSGGASITALGHDYYASYKWNEENYMAGVELSLTCVRCDDIHKESMTVKRTENGDIVTYTTEKKTVGGVEYEDQRSIKKDSEPYFNVKGGVTQASLTALGSDYDSEEKIETAMGQAIQTKAGYGGQKASHKLYDVELMIFKENGWKVANENDFPDGGVKVYLEYPEGTTKDGYEFTVAHMFTHTMNGKYSVGQIEIPKVTKTDYGIEFTVNGLSPIMVAWTQAQGAAGTNAKGISGVPQTGDAANVGVLLLCMVVSVAVGAGVVIRKRNGRA